MSPPFVVWNGMLPMSLMSPLRTPLLTRRSSSAIHCSRLGMPMVGSEAMSGSLMSALLSMDHAVLGLAACAESRRFNCSYSPTFLTWATRQGRTRAS